MKKNLKATLRQEARLARRGVRRLIKQLRFGSHSLTNAPILFANSFPKSGTHLLTQVLHGFTLLGPVVDSGLPAIVTFQGDTGRQRTEDEIINDFKRLQPGDIAYGHVHATSVMREVLSDKGFAAFFIFRDPRDVAVSHVHYVIDMAPQHIHHSYYKELMNFNERLHASITGFKRQEPGMGSSDLSYLPDIRERFEPYLGWLGCPAVICLKFEDFVNNGQAAVAEVFDHAVRRGFDSRRSRNEAIPILVQSIDPGSSPTFRSGMTGGWRAAFTEEHKDAFKEICGDLLIRLGYEENNDW